MDVVIRADAAEFMGSGHIMRCLTLARELRDNKARVYFVCRKLPGNMSEVIEKQGFEVFTFSAHNISEDAFKTRQIVKSLKDKKAKAADWLVIDHYDLDQSWQTELRPYVKNIMVIDDLANRRHDCDLLLDQNLFDNIQSRYSDLVERSCKLLLGPRYALLRPEFREARKEAAERDGKLQRVMVFFGSSDQSNQTVKALQAIRKLKRPDIAVDVVAGSLNPHREQVKGICEAMPATTFYCQISNMAELMAKADLAIGARGSTTWERCALGLPAITVIAADNQDDKGEALLLSNAEINLGNKENVDSEMILAALKKLLNDPDLLKKMSKHAYLIMDGSEDGPEAVVKAMLSF